MSSHNPTQIQPKTTPFNKAYFAPKSELLTWASKLLDLELTSFEQMRTGAIFCQLLDACHPGTVRLNKVNWKANCETDYISNFKIFQQGLLTNDIYKPIDINRLTKGKQYDLNELLQWVYGYYLNIKDNIKEVYNAKRKRGGQNFVFNDKKKDLKNKYRKKINKDNSKDRDNLTQISTNSHNQSSNNSVNNNYRKYFLNVSNLRQNLRNNNYRNITVNNNGNNQNENIRFRNKSKQETKNNQYYDFEEKVLNNIYNTNIYTQNKKVNNINTSNNINYNTINRRYPSNPILNTESNNNNFKTQSRRNFKNIFEKAPSEYQLVYDTENIKLNYEEDDLNNELENANDLDMTIFFGLNEKEVKDLMTKEKKDGNKIKDLKNIIRQLRINSLSLEKELETMKKAISEEYKLKKFYLNKLKDIEYLYFNPVIKNSNENKNTILRQLLCSNQDSTIYLDESNYAFLRNINHNQNVINSNKMTLSKKKNNKIIENINNMNNGDIIIEDKVDNNIYNKWEEINMDNSININPNNNIKKNENKNVKLNYSSKKNYNVNYMDNLLDSFNDNSKIENYKENKNPNFIQNNNINISNTFYSKITNENSNFNYQKDNGKMEEVYNGKKYLAYSEKKKEDLNNKEKNKMDNKTEFKPKGNNIYSEISSLLLNDSLHIPNI